MILHKEYIPKEKLRVQFVSFERISDKSKKEFDRNPNDYRLALCIDGKNYLFGKGCEHEHFLATKTTSLTAEFDIDASKLPKELLPYVYEIQAVINDNIEVQNGVSIVVKQQ